MPELTDEFLTGALLRLHDELGSTDIEQRALVGLRATGENEASLVDLDVADNGVVSLPEGGVDALLLVTGEVVETEGGEQAARQVVAILPDGQEIGIVRFGQDEDRYVWRAPDDEAPLRPADLSSNLARRALGLPSVADVPPVTELLARLWLLAVSQAALDVWDREGREVEPDDVTDELEDPFVGMTDDSTEDPVDRHRQLGGELTWERLRTMAVRGDLVVGPYSVDQEQAEWLDAEGFGQVLDDTVMEIPEILGALDIVGSEELLRWALEQLDARGWSHGGAQ